MLPALLYLTGWSSTFLKTFLALNINSSSLPNADDAKPIPLVNFDPRPRHPALIYPICTISHNVGKGSFDRRGASNTHHQLSYRLFPTLERFMITYLLSDWGTGTSPLTNIRLFLRAIFGQHEIIGVHLQRSHHVNSQINHVWCRKIAIHSNALGLLL